MYISQETIKTVVFALLAAMIIAFAMTPPVRAFACKVGAIDVPKDARRVHKTPIPRLGGLAIYIGFIISVVLFADITRQIQGILLGSVLIVVIGVIDDIVALKAWQKFLGQIIAALIPVFHGVVIEIVSHPNIFGSNSILNLYDWAAPVTVLWIVGITNAVNLIDGLDGLAVGVSTISSITMLIIAILLSNSGVAIILAALVGACIGFMPFNMNPARIFMGDTGALLLGFLLSTLSVVGFFKFYAIISFIVPFLALAMPIFDTASAIIRRLAKHQNPMAPDRGHLHHKLLDLGLNQKQAVFVIYVISGFLGMLAVILTSRGEIRIMFTLFLLVLAVVIGFLITKKKMLKPRDDNQSPFTSESEESKRDTFSQGESNTGDISPDGGSHDEN